MNDQPPVKDKLWTEKITRSGYFVGALLLHLVVFILIATWVVFPAFHPPDDPTTTAFRLPQPAPATPPVAPISPRVDVSSIAPAPAPEPPISVAGGNPDFGAKVPPVDLTDDGPTIAFKKSPGVHAEPKGIPADRLKQIKVMVERNTGRTPAEIADSPDDPRSITKAKFPVYLASYADGDWNCNVHLTDGKIDAGSLPDLVAKIGEWSHGHIEAEMVPNPLNIAGPDLIDKMPPFIFFTGHKDFVLTDAEIQNLRDYLQIGGAIWGDNAMAGKGSRFDVAFRREMQRVVGPNTTFEPVAANSEMFTKWFHLDKMPQGMNYYAESIEHIDLDGRLAILYTPNDYSDLFSMHILPGDTEVGADRPNLLTGDQLFTNGNFWGNRTVFFRNFELPSCLAAQRFGMNVIGYLLVRFDRDLLLSTP